MNPTRGRANGSGDIFKKGNDIVVCPLLDLENFRNRKTRPFPDFSRVLFRDLAELGHRFAREQFDLKPNLEFALVGPDIAHLRPRVTIDHAAR
jgi:hypothetical protein